jgi:hypothetical protein
MISVHYRSEQHLPFGLSLEVKALWICWRDRRDVSTRQQVLVGPLKQREQETCTDCTSSGRVCALPCRIQSQSDVRALSIVSKLVLKCSTAQV